MEEFILSKHAQQRARDMGLDDDFVQLLLTEPHVTHVNQSPTHGDSRRYCRDEVAAIVALDRPVVITFLPATERRWLAEDERLVPGRRFDADRWHHR